MAGIQFYMTTGNLKKKKNGGQHLKERSTFKFEIKVNIVKWRSMLSNKGHSCKSAVFKKCVTSCTYYVLWYHFTSDKRFPINNWCLKYS